MPQRFFVKTLMIELLKNNFNKNKKKKNIPQEGVSSEP